MTLSFFNPLMCSFLVVRPSTRPQSSMDEPLDEPSPPWTCEGISWYPACTGPISKITPISIHIIQYPYFPWGSLRFQICFQIPGGKSRTRRDLGTTSGVETVHASELNPFPLKLDLQFCQPRRDSLPEAMCQPSGSHDSKLLWMDAKVIWHLTSNATCPGWCFRSRGWSWSR